MGLDDTQDNGLDVQHVGIISGFLCTENGVQENEEQWEKPEDATFDPADIGLEIGSFDDEQQEETDQKPNNKH